MRAQNRFQKPSFQVRMPPNSMKAVIFNPEVYINHILSEAGRSDAAGAEQEKAKNRLKRSISQGNPEFCQYETPVLFFLLWFTQRVTSWGKHQVQKKYRLGRIIDSLEIAWTMPQSFCQMNDCGLCKDKLFQIILTIPQRKFDPVGKVLLCLHIKEWDPLYKRL